MAAMKWWSCRLCARPARKAGEVEELDAGEHREGTFAEWISVPVRNVFAMPEQLDFVQAGALDVNFLTTCWPLPGTKPSCPLWTAISPQHSIHAALSRLESGQQLGKIGLNLQAAGLQSNIAVLCPMN
jgi:hypothetical protein